MDKHTNEVVEDLLKTLAHRNYIRPDELPNIDLYMDQVTTFMDARLSPHRRYDDDKVLTKTMINNYAKNNMLPPPVKKKYSREHMLLLTFIYYFKNLLSIGDIQNLLKPLTDGYFSKDGQIAGSISLSDIYKEILEAQLSQVPTMEKDLRARLDLACHSFEQVPESEQEFLQLFMLICTLGYDVYVKKQLIEKLIDQVISPKNKEEKESQKSKEGK